MPFEFTSPVGRIVQGAPLRKNTTDKHGKQLTVKTGPNAGQDTENYFIVVAFPKIYPAGHPKAGLPNEEWAALWGQLYNEGRTAFPHLFNGPGGACTHQRFTFKYKDGDGNDSNGVQNSTKTGFAGHHVLTFSSNFPPQCVNANGQPITDPDAIKTGYFVRVIGSAKSNAPSDVPGLYVNLIGVQLVAYGEEIRTGPNVAAMFAAAGPAALPPGASAAPLGVATPPAGGLPPAPGGAPAGLPVPPAVGGLPVPPGAAAVPPAGLPPLAAPAATLPPVFVATAAMPPGHSIESLTGQGYTMDQLVTAGYVTKQAPPANPAILGAPGLPPLGAAPAALPGLPPPPGAGGLPPGPAVVAAPVYTMTAQAGAYTREQYHTAGYTDDMMIAQGLMTKS